MLPELIAGGTSVLGSLIGGIGNIFSTNRTNQMNLEIARMNNEFNEDMMFKQMQYNTDMWNAQNEYNTPAAQRARLEEAGLNPYMMLDGGSAGTAGSAGGITPPTAQGVTMQAPQFDTQSLFQSLGHLASLISTQDIRREQARSLSLDNDIIEVSKENLIAQETERLLGLKEDNRGKALANDLQEQTIDYQVKRMGLENEVLEAERDVKLAQIASLKLDNETKEIMNKYLPAFQQQQLLILGQQYANLIEQGKLTRAQAIREMASSDLIKAQTVNEGLKGSILAQDIASGHLDYSMKLRMSEGIINATNFRNAADSEYFKNLDNITRARKDSSGSDWISQFGSTVSGNLEGAFNYVGGLFK